MNASRTFDTSKFFGLMGGKKYQIFGFLLQNRNAENQVILTTTELAEKLKMSRDTVSRTLNILRKCGAITTRTGVITVNPEAITLDSPK